MKTPDNIKGLPMVLWDKIYHSNKIGGSSLQKTEATNNKILSKRAWETLSLLKSLGRADELSN